MSVKLLKQDTEVVDGKLVVTSQTEEVLDIHALRRSLEDIERQKQHCRDEAKRLQQAYDALSEKGATTKRMIAQLAVDDENSDLTIK